MYVVIPACPVALPCARAPVDFAQCADEPRHCQDEARIYVQSEDEPIRTLLETRVTKDDGYQKQQGETGSCGTNWRMGHAENCADTLIVWTEQNGTDMALSFQEAEGCGAIWYALMLGAAWGGKLLITLPGTSSVRCNHALLRFQELVSPLLPKRV